MGAPWRKCAFRVAEQPAFENFITVLIVLNVFVLASKHRDMSDAFKDQFLLLSNWFFTLAFAFEAALKLVAYGPRNYFTQEWVLHGAMAARENGAAVVEVAPEAGSAAQEPETRGRQMNGWNDFDFFLVLVSIGDKIGDFKGMASFFRIFRVLRILRAARKAKELKRLAQTIIISIPALGNVGSLLMLLLFIFSILGVNFFYSACGVPPYFALEGGEREEPCWRANMELPDDNQPFDPCSDPNYGFGFEGFVSVNLEINAALWYAHAMDADVNGDLTYSEFSTMEKALQRDFGYVLNNSTFGLWQSNSNTISIEEITEIRLLFVNLTDSHRIALAKWAAAVWDDKEKSDRLEMVEAVEYIERSKFDAEEWKWLWDYSQQSGWAGSLKCTEMSMVCDGYKEPEQNLLDDQEGKPPYSACACENLDWNANFATLARAFVTLIRMSTGEYWNGIMHDLIDQGHTYAFLYFFTFMVLATFIMLNLVVAVILNNYEQMDQTEQSPTADRSEGANYEVPESKGRTEPGGGVGATNEGP